MYVRCPTRYRSDVRLFLAVLAATGLAPMHLGSGDDVQPRDTVSVIESVTPAMPAGVRVDVVGGDTFMRLRADGHAASVPGYEGEKYIEMTADGTVRENTASTTSKLNVNRFGNADVPDETGDVSWRTISHNGTAMWHDHRIHWMSPSTPAVIDAEGTVQHWTLTLVVDGTSHTVAGTLYLRGRHSVLWWFTGLVGAMTAAFLAVRSRKRFYASLTWVAALGTVTGLLQWLSLPSAARVTPLMLMFGIGALIAANVGMVLHRHTDRGPQMEWIASSMSAGSGAAMLLAAWMSWQQVQSAYVPMIGPAWVARITVTTLLGAGVVAVVDGVLRAVRVQPNPD